MELVNYIIAGICIILAFLINAFPQMLNGYNNIPEENKPKAKRLSFNMLLISGIGCLALALVISLSGLSGVWCGIPLIYFLAVSMIYIVMYSKLGAYGGFSRTAVIVAGVLVVQIRGYLHQLCRRNRHGGFV